MKYIVSLCMLLFSITVVFAGGQPESTDSAPGAQESGEVNVYSHRHYETDQELFDLFEEKTGIRVNVVKASADELIERLANEGAESPADILITVDAGRLHRAKEMGLLQPVQSAALSASIPENLRDPEGYWFGVTQRARVIVYHKDRVDPADLSTYAALTDPVWRGRVLTRSSGNIYNQSLIASFVAQIGEDETRNWAQGLVANFARDPEGNDRDQMRAIAAGVGDVAIVNTYYVGLLVNSDNPEEQRVGEMVGVFFPDQQGRGTHVNVSGIGVTASSSNRENAIRFIEFMTDEEAQSVFAQANYEYPVHPDVDPADLLQSWGSFRANDVNLAAYGDYYEEAVAISDEVGWR